MRFGRLTHALLVAVFVVGQSLALLHATSHELKPERSASCEICAIAHASGAPPASMDLATTWIPRGAEPATLVVPSLPRQAPTRPNSRGPPPFLA